MNTSDFNDPSYEHAHQLMLSNQLEGEFRTSSSYTDAIYLDGFRMLLADMPFWKAYFEQRIRGLTPVGTGRSGALILGILGKGILWNGSKNYGLEWANYPVKPGLLTFPSRRMHWPVLDQLGVVLVDDCRFTGKTLSSLRLACARQGMEVIDEVVAWPYQLL
jgi:hypothetical protein